MTLMLLFLLMVVVWVMFTLLRSIETVDRQLHDRTARLPVVVRDTDPIDRP